MANPWKRLQSLLPEDPVQIGTVQVDNADGTYGVDLVGGGRITVTGSGYSVNQRVFVRGTMIMSAAPDLPVVEIEV